MEIDYTGTLKVADLIGESRFSKFCILKYGTHRNSAPVYESSLTSTPAGAKEKFMQWAKLTDNSNAYDIILYNTAPAAPGAVSHKKKVEGEAPINQKEVRFTFQLKGEAEKPSGGSNFKEMIEMALDKQAQAYENSALRKEIEELREEARLRYEEEDDREQAPTVDYMGILTGLATKFLNNTDSKPALAVSGVIIDDRLQKALNTLHQNDENMVSDIEKLALMSEKAKPTFDMMLLSLRNLKL